MTEWLLEVWVPGLPAPQGSVRAIIHRSTGRPVVVKDNNDRQKAWRKAIATYAGIAWDQPPLDGPVVVDLEFVMPRPVSTPKRSTPPAIRKPDGDKLERATWDALTGTVWVDDARVVAWSGSKRIAELGEPTGVRIRVGRQKPAESNSPAFDPPRGRTSTTGALFDSEALNLPQQQGQSGAGHPTQTAKPGQSHPTTPERTPA